MPRPMRPHVSQHFMKDPRDQEAKLSLFLGWGQDLYGQRAQAFVKDPIHLDPAAELELAEDFEDLFVGTATLGRQAAFPFRHVFASLLLAVRADFDEVLALG